MAAAPKHRLTRSYFLWLSIISLSSIVIMATLWIRHELNRSDEESRRITEEYFQSLESSISVETNRVVDYLKAQTASSQVKFYLNVKTRVQEIHDMLSGYLKERGDDALKSEEAKSALLALLRHLSYDGGKGGYFCSTMDGKILLDGSGEAREANPGKVSASSFAPDVLAKSLASVAIIGEGFYRIPLVEKTPDGRMVAKEEVPVTFLKRFAGLDWTIGASEYYSDFERNLGNELVSWVDNAPIPADESLLVLDYEGKVLSYRDPTIIGLNVFDGDRGTGLMTAAAKSIRGAKSATKGFARFTLRPPFNTGGDLGVECVAYYRTVPGWRWVVVNFVNISKLEQTLKAQEAALSQNLKSTITQVAATTAITLLVIFFISTLISRKAGASLGAFFNFFEKASSSTVEINPDDQPFEEFARLAEAANSMIRERREADRKLSDSELKFRTFFSVSPEIIAILDGEGRVMEANPEFERFSGKSLEEARGQKLFEAIGADDSQWERLAGELAGKGQIDGQELVLERGQDKIFLLVFSKTMPYLSEKLIVWVCVNITSSRLAEMERAELKERLARSRTMESMGRMASSVAHELNNILSALIGYPELLMEDPQLAEGQRSQIGEILDAGHRASAVVGDLLTLSSGVATAKTPVNLDELAEKILHGPAVTKALSSAPATITMESSLSSKAVVKGSPTHMRKVVSNLVQNAIDILWERGGHIEVKTSLKRLDSDPGCIANFSPGHYAELSISDNGPGISESDLPHIFEPFYSKKSGSGHGLGLALVELTVREHGGGVRVDTSPAGTSIRVLFPASLAAPKAAVLGRTELRGQGQKILVVDDVDIQRKLAQKMLRTLGYSPQAVSSGEEAVVYLRENDVDLVILDMIMDPGINGRQTYEAILSFKPGQKAIIASGLAESDEVVKAQALGASQFVSKPYTLDDIAGAVHKALRADDPKAASPYVDLDPALPGPGETRA